ncbi:hypothetical protein [Gordonia sp. NPDC003376]
MRIAPHRPLPPFIESLRLVLLVRPHWTGAVKTISSTEAKARLDAVLAEVERTG